VADRRVRYVTLTAAGREAVDRAAMRCLHLLDQAAQLLPVGDLAMLRATCALLHEGTLRGHPADSPSPTAS
jgi:DNA-binding MarR family transcriptional regulator